MCYDIKTKLETQLKRAKHYHDQPWIDELEEKLRPYSLNDFHHVSGFTHPSILIYTTEAPFEPALYQWGLVPSWVHNHQQKLQLWNKTMIARGESVCEKPAFKSAAKSKHCVVYVDGFFEHHYFNGKSYPFYIYRKDNLPLALAGLYEHWVEKDSGEIVNTFCIITTKANTLMQKIHNNPKVAESRMPVILSDDLVELWLNKTDSCSVNRIIEPFSSMTLKAHTVAPLSGKKSPGNVECATDKFVYPELPKAM